jgi:hypothetical protein
MRLTSAARRGALTPALPMPYPALENFGLRLRRGQVSLTVAAPGVGKSQLWNNLAQRMGVPTVYWSADTDQHDVMMRTIALWSGSTTADVERNISEPSWAEHYGRTLTAGAHVEWVFDSSITPRVVGERMKAFAEVHGQYPHLFVVDNLSNTVQNQADELSEQKEVMVAMQRLARESDAHISILAHAKGVYDSGDKPIPQSGALNNLFKIPETGLTLHRADAAGNHLGLNVVKNRGGKADPGAQHPIRFEVDYSRGTVAGFRRAA